MTGMRTVGEETLRVIQDAARNSPRLRKNHNLHDSDTSACHRLFNGIEPGSYIRPHRHLHEDKDETFLIVKGSLGIVTFDADGAVTGSALLSAASGNVAADIPHGVYHTAVALETGTIFFEAKAGPYLPLAEEEKGSFAPEEGSPGAAAYLKSLTDLFR
jgi:cupin fold WbuC family metalloprotein